jgi:aminomethyltransferase
MVVPLLLHGKHAGPTVVYEPFGHWIVPWRFHSFDEEYQALRRAAGLIDYSTQALIECRGTDRISFLHRLLTNDIARLSPGAGCQAALLTPSAKLIADMVVIADPDSLWLLCDLQRAHVVAQTLERYLFSEQVILTNHERQKAVLALQGPRTLELLIQVSGTVVSLPNPGDHVVLPLQGLPVRLIRHTLTGGVGTLCVIDAEEAEPVWELLKERGRPFGLRPVGWQALNTARIEAGLPWFGMDMDETNLLPETGLETVAVSETKGCYLGQEIIARMQTYGSPNKKLMGLLLEGDHVPEVGDRITPASSSTDTAGRRNGEVLGQVTSACQSPILKRPIAMGYLKRGAYEPGTAVEILRGATCLAAMVAARPLVQSGDVSIFPR